MATGLVSGEARARAQQPHAHPPLQQACELELHCPILSLSDLLHGDRQKQLSELSW